MRSKPRKSAAELAIADHLRTVASAFIEAQEQRHIAEEVLSQIATVDAAFQSWRVIRDEDMAQDWLVSLLVKDR